MKIRRTVFSWETSMKVFRIGRALATLSVALCAVGYGSVAHAQAYPDRPIKIINPYTPGGSVDPVLRPLTQKMQEYLGQSVVTEYKPGAGTNIGSDFVAKSKPDGYTLLLATSSLAISPALYKSLPYDALRDLTPVAYVGDQPFSIVISTTQPFKSVQELLAFARANPGKLSFGSSGNGGAVHLGMELLKSLTNTQMLHIPYKGGAQTLTALLAGDIQVMLSPPSNFVQHIASGRVRMIGMASTRRVAGFDVPTVIEQGVPGFTAGVWYAVYAPSGTPQPILDKLHQTITRAMNDKQMIETYQKLVLVPGGGSIDELKAGLRAEIQRWEKVVKDSGAKID